MIKRFRSRLRQKKVRRNYLIAEINNQFLVTQSLASMKFSDRAIIVLERAGWFPGRDIQPQAAKWGEVLRAFGFTMFAAAETVLSEFGGLELQQYPDLDQSGLLPISFDVGRIISEGVESCVMLKENFELFEEALGMSLFPIGDSPDGYVISISEDGRVFGIFDDMQMLGIDFADALSNMVIGRQTHEHDFWVEGEKVVSNQTPR